MYTELGDERGIAMMITRLAVHAANVEDVPRTRDARAAIARRSPAGWTCPNSRRRPSLRSQAPIGRRRTRRRRTSSRGEARRCRVNQVSAGGRPASCLTLLELGIDLQPVSTRPTGRVGKVCGSSIAIEDRLYVAVGSNRSRPDRARAGRLRASRATLRGDRPRDKRHSPRGCARLFPRSPGRCSTRPTSASRPAAGEVGARASKRRSRSHSAKIRPCRRARARCGRTASCRRRDRSPAPHAPPGTSRPAPV